MKTVYILKSLWLRLSPLSKCHSWIKEKSSFLPLIYNLLTLSPLLAALALFLQFNTSPYLLSFVLGKPITVRIHFVAWWQSCTRTMSHSCQNWCTGRSTLLLCLCSHSPHLKLHWLFSLQYEYCKAQHPRLLPEEPQIKTYLKTSHACGHGRTVAFKFWNLHYLLAAAAENKASQQYEV